MEVNCQFLIIQTIEGKRVPVPLTACFYVGFYFGGLGGILLMEPYYKTLVHSHKAVPIGIMTTHKCVYKHTH